jgi:hypothetical protein
MRIGRIKADLCVYVKLIRFNPPNPRNPRSNYYPIRNKIRFNPPNPRNPRSNYYPIRNKIRFNSPNPRNPRSNCYPLKRKIHPTQKRLSNRILSFIHTSRKNATTCKLRRITRVSLFCPQISATHIKTRFSNTQFR